MSKLSQVERVVARLRRGPADTLHLRALYILSTSARVADARKIGHVIVATPRAGRSGTTVYRLVGSNR
jgi:hypothetical protein